MVGTWKRRLGWIIGEEKLRLWVSVQESETRKDGHC